MPETYMKSEVKIVQDSEDNERNVKIRVPKELQKAKLSVPKTALRTKLAEIVGFEIDECEFKMV